MERPIGVTILSVLYLINAAVISATFLYAVYTINSLIQETGLGSSPNMMCFAAPTVILTLIPVMIGVGLYKGVETARGIALGFAVISLIFIPIGTLMGIIIIHYLQKPEVKAWFAQQNDAGGQGLSKA